MTEQICPTPAVVVLGVAALVEILVTPGCPHVEAAVDLVGRLADETKTRPRVVLVEVSSLVEAERHGFAGSPTIRVNGVDVSPAPANAAALSCRTYQTDHGPSCVPDARQVAEALIRAAQPPLRLPRR